MSKKVLILLGILTFFITISLKKEIPDLRSEIPNNICPDNTLNLECSQTKPFFCENQKLIPSCEICGCPENMHCKNNACFVLSPLYPKEEEEIHYYYEAKTIESFETTTYSSIITNEPPKTSFNIPVLMLSYLPQNPNNPNELDLSIVGPYLQEGTTINDIKRKITQLSNELISSLEKGSTFHKYKDPSSEPALKHSIIDSKEFLRPILRTTNTDFLFLNNRDWGVTADHYNELKNIDICDYVENKGVKEVWIWMYHYVPLDSNQNPLLDHNRYYVSPVESNMSGPFGNISNSFRVNDLPLCKKTYTVYEFNYTRGLGEALENYTHQIEAVLGNADYDTFWNKFVGGKNSPTACGWTHCPPNVMPICETHNYDWENRTQIYSDCQNWNPDRTGEAELLDCHTWSGEECKEDTGTAFKIWWMQNIPQKWWIYIGDFDKAMSENKGLLY